MIHGGEYKKVNFSHANFLVSERIFFSPVKKSCCKKPVGKAREHARIKLPDKPKFQR